MVSSKKSGGGILFGEKKDGGSHSREWRGSGMLSWARWKATAVTRAGIENFETIAKQLA